MFEYVKEGDTVHRLLAETVHMRLKVTKVDEKLIYCGTSESPVTLDPTQGWTFDRKTGVEVDEELGWGPQYGITGSRLVDPATVVN